MCAECGIRKPFADYTFAKNMPDLKCTRCRECDSKRGKRYRKANPEVVRETWLKSRYGITSGEYEELLARQEGRCCICGVQEEVTKSKSNFSVDHCHKSGDIRGLLCNACNASLGGFKDSVDILQKAIDYLLKHKQEAPT